MGEIREEGVSDSLKKNKKHKKRKHGEDVVLGGEDNAAVLVDEGGRQKKAKTDVLGSDGATEGVHGVDLKVTEDKRAKKEKKRKESGLREEGGKKRGKKEKKAKKSDGKSMSDEGSSDVKNSEVGVVIDEVKVRGKKEKKKKSKTEPKSIGADDAGPAEMQIVNEGIEKAEPAKKKKRKDTVDGVTEKDEPAKDEKQKKKGSHDVTDKVEHSERKKKKEKDGRDTEVGVVIEEVKVKKGKKEKKKKSKTEQKSTGADDTGPNDIVEPANIKKRKDEFDGVTGKEEPAKDKKQKKKKDAHGVTDKVEHAERKKRKEKDGRQNTEENAAGPSLISERNEPTPSNLNKKSKKVKFADSVEVFPLPEYSSEGNQGLVNGGAENPVAGDRSNRGKEKLEDGNKDKIQGKRFSKEEDEKVKAAVLQYIEDHHLGEEGLEMVLKCRVHKDKVKDCWKEIAEALPWRTQLAVYSRAHILFERSEKRTWTKEELEEVRKYHEKNGPKWRKLADELGRNRIHVKDAFRQVRLANKKDGQWSQDEYQTLFNLVNKDLRIRARMDRKTQHGMLRDNIGWEAISGELTTRTDPICCQKWYNQLSSSLVSSGKWADSDDYRLLMALFELDATCEEDVEWDYILEHRPADVCRKRWHEMVRHIGEHGLKSFSEQVEILFQRYCPDILEAREAYDSKPAVD